MSTLPMNGTLPQYAKYIGEFVPSDDNIKYFYFVVAYNRSRAPITSNTVEAVSAWGPEVLDERHVIMVRWHPVIGASYFVVYKSIGLEPTNVFAMERFWIASATETGIADNGYPVGTRGYDLNPGISPLFIRQAPCPPTDKDPCTPCPDDPCNDDGDTGGILKR